MDKERLNDYLKKENSELLGNFKWGMEGSNDFGCFMRLVRQTIEQQQEKIKWLEVHNLSVEEIIRHSEEKDAEIKGLKTLLEGERDLRKATDELLQEARDEINGLDHHIDFLDSEITQYQAEIERLKELIPTESEMTFR